MRKYLKYLIGGIIILIGLALKMTLNHRLEYWGNVTAISRLLFIPGLGLLLVSPAKFLSQKTKFPDSRIEWFKLNGKKVLIVVLILGGVFVLDWSGQKLNYGIRNYYLSENTETTVGTIVGIKTINYARLGSEKFYVIDLTIDQRKMSQGLLIKYANRDNDYFEKFKVPTITAQKLILDRLKGSHVEILYSKRFPSFFRVND